MNQPKKRVVQCGYCGRPVRASLAYTTYYTGWRHTAVENILEWVKEVKTPTCDLCYEDMGYVSVRNKMPDEDDEIDPQDVIDFDIKSIPGISTVYDNQGNIK